MVLDPIVGFYSGTAENLRSRTSSKSFNSWLHEPVRFQLCGPRRLHALDNSKVIGG